MARVLTTSHYAGTFNTPRNSRHTMVPVRFPGHLRALWSPLEAVAVWNPLTRYDLIHAFNRIPVVTRKPWLVTFESALPRTPVSQGAQLRRMLRARLLADDCRGLIAMSDYARRRFVRHNAGWARLDDVLAKTRIMHPNIPLQATEPRDYAGGELRLIFVGNDFARKGGVVALRVAQQALAQGLPVHLDVVSTLNYGGEKYTDHPDRARYEPDLELLNLPNVTHHTGLSNTEVLRLFQASHIQLLPTIHDTYGYSVLEGFAAGVPALVTDTCALPEVVRSGENGHLLSFETDDIGDWVHLGDRARDDFWATLDATYEDLARQSVVWLATLANDPERYRPLSAGAIDRIRQAHDAERAGALLDKLYAEIAGT